MSGIFRCQDHDIVRFHKQIDQFPERSTCRGFCDIFGHGTDAFEKITGVVGMIGVIQKSAFMGDHFRDALFHLRETVISGIRNESLYAAAGYEAVFRDLVDTGIGHRVQMCQDILGDDKIRIALFVGVQDRQQRSQKIETDDGILTALRVIFHI